MTRVGRLLRPGQLLVTASLCGLLVACTPSDERGPAGDRSAVPNQALGSLVVQPGDLPGTFVVFDEGVQTTRDAGPGVRADLSRFGRQGGWKARYRNGDRSVTAGLLVLESRVDVFAGEKGAKQELAAYRTEFERAAAQGDAQLADVPRIGDAAQGTTLVQGADESAPRFHTVAWRFRNAVGAVTAQGAGNEFTVQAAVTIARQQQARLRRAARP